MKLLFYQKFRQYPGKKSASSNSMKDTLGKPRIESKWYDGNASIFTPFSSITVSFVSKTVRPLALENSFFILSIKAIAKSILGIDSPP
jgi:hypothetical protein